MEHPLIGNIDDFTLEQLQERVNDLYNKRNMAHRMGNAHLRAQIEMALETYQNKLREKQDAEWRKSTGGRSGLDDKINIS